MLRGGCYKCTRLKHEIQDLIDSGKIVDPESKKPSTYNNPLPNYRNVPPPNQHVLMIDTGLTEEQVLNSFVDLKPIMPTQPTNNFERGLIVNMMDIWSSDDERNDEKVDVWDNEREYITEHVASTAPGKEVEEEEPTAKMEMKAEPKREEDENKRPKKVVASIWELLMQSKVHRDAMVQALHERKVPIGTTPEQLASSLM